MATTFFTHDHYESRGTMALFAGMTAVGMLTGRRLIWEGVRKLRKRGLNQTHALIVGTSRVARKTARALRHASWMGIRCIGFVEDNASRWAADLKVLGTIADLPDLVAKHRIEHVFIAVPLNRHAEARKVFDVLAQSLVEVRLVLDVPNLAGLSLTTANLDGLPVIGLRESPHFGLNLVLARHGRGPVADRRHHPVADAHDGGRDRQALESRAGFLQAGAVRAERQAVPNAEVSDHADGRGGPDRAGLGDQGRPATDTARLISSAHQLGRVSTAHQRSKGGHEPGRSTARTAGVHPPIQPNNSELYGPPLRQSRCDRAAQVHGWRGNTSLRKRLQYDLYYITHWSPFLDIRILWMTVFRGLLNRNAY